MARSATKLRISEAVDERSFGSRNTDALGPAPFQLHTGLKAGTRDPKHAKRMAENLHVGCSHRGGRDDEGRSEELFGQTPVLGRTPATDVAGREDFASQHPRIFDRRTVATLGL